MISADPAADWDRYCRDMDAPRPIEKSRQVRSRARQHCASCLSSIEPEELHEMIPQLDDIGLWCSPLRLHLPGKCSYPEGEDWS